MSNVCCPDVHKREKRHSPFIPDSGCHIAFRHNAKCHLRLFFSPKNNQPSPLIFSAWKPNDILHRTERYLWTMVQMLLRLVIQKGYILLFLMLTVSSGAWPAKEMGSKIPRHSKMKPVVWGVYFSPFFFFSAGPCKLQSHMMVFFHEWGPGKP